MKTRTNTELNFFYFFISFSLILTFSINTFATTIDEDFSKENALENLTWIGTTEKFTLYKRGDSQELRIVGDENASDSAYLVTSTEILDEITWEATFRTSASLSKNNFSTFILHSETSDIFSDENKMLFVKVGGSGKDICLCLGNWIEYESLLCSNKDSIPLDFPLNVRIQKNKDNLFSLHAQRTEMENEYIPLGETAIDLDCENEGFSGFAAKFTKTNYNKFYFDNLKIYNPQQPDTTTLYVNQIETSPQVITLNQDGVDDEFIIKYPESFIRFTAHISIFNSSGIEVCRLLNNETLNDDGFLRWNGTDNNNRIVPIGLYIIVIDLVNTSTGERFQDKKVCVVS